MSSVKSHKAILEYLVVVPLPPGYNMCKWYKNSFLKEVEQFDLECWFLHADKVECSKITMIKWLSKGLYNKIFPSLGGFQTLLVKLKILQKNMAYQEKTISAFIMMQLLQIPWIERLKTNLIVAHLDCANSLLRHLFNLELWEC